MFDLRYHVASLAAVFIALVLGILVGIGMSGRGLIRESERLRLQAQIDRLNREAEMARLRAREQEALGDYESATYPAVMDGRLLGRRVGVVYIGSSEGDVAASIEETLFRADASPPSRLRALKVPIATGDLLRAVSDVPEAPRTVEELGRALAQEFVDGGETPLWQAVGPLIVEEREGAAERPLDAVVVARTAEAQRGQTARFLAEFYAGLAAAGVPVVGVETTEANPSTVPVYRDHGLSTVDNVETASGRLALAVLLQGEVSPGAYGVKNEADAVLPTIEPVTLPTG